jgi:hypothetical protein
VSFSRADCVALQINLITCPSLIQGKEKKKKTKHNALAIAVCVASLRNGAAPNPRHQAEQQVRGRLPATGDIGVHAWDVHGAVCVAQEGGKPHTLFVVLDSPS